MSSSRIVEGIDFEFIIKFVLGFQWESEAPAGLATKWFGRSLSLPANELEW